MPFTNAQVRLFAAAAHQPEIAAKHGMSMGKARDMQMEAPPAQRSAAMKRRALAKVIRGHR